MRKFFKSLAVLLALTLIVGVIPAAAADSLSMQKEKVLYLDGSKGQKEDGTQCKTSYKKLVANMIKGFDKDTMSVVLSSADKDIVKTTKAGRIVAKSLGTTTVKVVVKKDGTEFWTKDLTVTVKKNATDLVVKGIEDGGKYALDNKLEISMPRYADGKKVDTDQRSLTADSESVKIVDNKNRTFTVTFDKTGEYKLTAKSYQSARYPGATQEKTFSIKVTAPDYEVKQTVYNAFTVTFSSKEIATKACEATKKSLTDGKADVTQTSEMIEVKRVEAADEEISAFIGDVQQKDNVLTITMFADLLEDKVYRVLYGDHEPVEFKAVKWIPATMTNGYSYVPNMEEKGGTAKLNYKILSAEGVDITGKVSQSGVIEYSDRAAKNEYDKYSVSGEQVDFYADEVDAPVMAKFTWYGAVDNKALDITNPFTVIAKDTRKYAVEYYLLGTPTNPVTIDKKREATICVDEGVKVLNLRIAVDLDSDGVYGDDFDGDGTTGRNGDADDYLYTADVKLVTSNADKLSVEEIGGATYAPKNANEVVGVYVYYKDMLIDADVDKPGINPIPVTVYDKKTLSDLTVGLASGSDGKYSYSALSAAQAWYDALLHYSIDGKAQQFEIKAVDQFKNQYDNVKITIEKSTDVLDVAGGKGSVTLVTVGTMDKGDTYTYPDGTGKVTPSFTATSVDNAVRNVSFKATAEDLITKKKITKSFSFTVKNTTESTVISQVIEKDNNKFYVYGKDSAGYKVCGYYLDTKANVYPVADGGNGTVSGKVYLDIYNNSNGSTVASAPAISLDGKYISLVDTRVDVGGGLTKLSAQSKCIDNGMGLDSDDLEAITKYTAAATHFIPTGSYSAKAYKVNKGNKPAILTSLPFNYAPTTHAVEFTWKTAYSEYTNVANVLNDAFVFTTYEWYQDTNDWQWKWKKHDDGKKFSELTYDMVVSYVENDNMITFLYAYTYDPYGNVISETLINRNVYIGVSK